jgi:hypothetical protein
MIDEEIATLKNDIRVLYEELSGDLCKFNERLSKLENNNQAAEIGPRNEDGVF